MNLKIKSALPLFTALLFTTACNDNKSTKAQKNDTTTLETTTPNSDTATGNTNSPGTDMMGSMNGMMEKMHGMKMSGDFDADWANMMIEHHQGAIDMAQAELSQGKDEKMKSKAQEIIAKQKDEQQKLRDIAKNLKASSMKMGEGELEKSMSGMMDKMKSMQMAGDIDKDFASMMIQHHEDGVAMAKLEVKNGMNATLKKIAQTVISDQQKEINEFRQWLSANK